jgi:GT2 family glycosyltransferase
MTSLRPVKADEKIAVAIPTRNRASYLAVLMSSLLNQTYTDFMIVINDQSDSSVERDDAITDLTTLARNTGHEVKFIRTEGGWKRHQQAMEAVPEQIDIILRIDDDMLPDPRFLENILKPFRFFPDRPLAAVGGCNPEPNVKPVNLDVNLADNTWTSKLEDPTWRLQGHLYYSDPEVLEVESLNGGAICYRRSAVEDAGGWAVEGYSDHAFREENDLCARLLERNYSIMVTTEALAWHLLAPGGGAREFIKTPRGNYIISDMSGIESDNKLFLERMKLIAAKRGPAPGEPRRYKVSDLEKNLYKSSPLRTLKGSALKLIERSVLRKLRGLYWYFKK